MVYGNKEQDLSTPDGFLTVNPFLLCAMKMYFQDACVIYETCMFSRALVDPADLRAMSKEGREVAVEVDEEEEVVHLGKDLQR